MRDPRGAELVTMELKASSSDASTPEPIANENAVVIGYLDGYAQGYLEGWAYYPNRPGEKVELLVYVDGVQITYAIANLPRDDLRLAGIGDARHAFRVYLPDAYYDGKVHELDIRTANTGTSIENSPLNVCTNPPICTFSGRIDRIEHPIIEGWCWNSRYPAEILEIEICAGDRLLASIKADIYREDLKESGIADGYKGFSLKLPELSPEQLHHVTAKVKGSDYYLAQKPVEVPTASNGAAHETVIIPTRNPNLQGHFDGITEYGIRGWAINHSNTNAPVSIDIFVDDRYTAQTTASFFRPDLKQANIGNGEHGFNAPLHPNLLDGVTHEVRAYYSNTSEELPGSPKNFTFAQTYPIQQMAVINHFVEQCIGNVKGLGDKLNNDGPLQNLLSEMNKTSTYQQWWQRYRAITEEDRRQMLECLYSMPHKPVISILMPTYNTPVDFLRAAVESVLKQNYPYWELCIADDASTSEETIALLKEYAKKYKQIKVNFRKKNGHISEATNSALAMAEGEYIAFFDHDDLLTEDALFTMAMYINQHQPDILYSDEDKIDEKGAIYDPHFKPDFNYTQLLSCNYICHFTLIRKTLTDKIGGFISKFNGSQDHDYFLRSVEIAAPEKIVHVPYILYHWRAHAQSTALSLGAKSYAVTAGVKAVEAHLARTKQKAVVRDNKWGLYDVRWTLPRKKPKVSVIIPTRDCANILSLCLSTLFNKTHYDNFEVIIVNNQSVEEATFETFEEAKKYGNVRVVDYDKPFNYSAISNLGAKYATGELLCMLNNDIEILDGHEDWLDEMVGQALRPNVGAVGAKLLYPNDYVQHAGVILGIQGVAGHAHKKCHNSDSGYFSRLVVAQELSCCTAACLLIQKSVFEQIGGFDEKNLPVSFNDVDLCLRIREQGHKIIFTPLALLRHHESFSRGPEDTPGKALRAHKEVKYMRKRWGQTLDTDPYYNINLTMDLEDFSIDLRRGAQKIWTIENRESQCVTYQPA